MEKMSVGEFKANFSEVLKKVMAGEEIGISYGKKKEIVARLVPKETTKKPRRKIGILDGKGKASFSKDFKITEEEFLGL
jgi:prevent-host-death family protein